LAGLELFINYRCRAFSKETSILEMQQTI
jgi:hypothetical protein